MSSKVSRNDRCPCGSGKKYKACCEAGDASGRGRKSKILMGVLGVAVLGGLAVVVSAIFDTDSGPVPWEYNAVTNQHYDPTPGHQHMHLGRPPADRAAAATIDPNAAIRRDLTPTPVTATVPVPPPAAATASDGAPAPWEYDAEKDQHWNPESAQWDTGMPPLEAFTSN